jgi:Aspartyl-tRNA synthetase
MQKRFMIRAQIVKSCHEYLDGKDFIEVETPSLTLSSPEGATEYLVPSRIHHGSFYALPQSPQLFKQLLMVAGFERYYQIAKCFRDEDLRADRQPDFTQVDLETSFLNEDQILTLAEGLIQKVFKDTINYDVKLPLRRMEYDIATSKYGSDKPDTRFGMLLEDVKEILSNTDFMVYKNAKYISAICVNGIAKDTSRKKIDEYNIVASKFGMKGFGVFKIENGTIDSSLSKFYKPEILEELKQKMNAKDGDVIFVAANDNKKNVYFGLGALRSQFGHSLGLVKPNTYDLLWVTKFPLFGVADDGHIVAEHHPFTRPC